MYKNRSLISDWDTLRLVLAIDRNGGVSGAARFLGVTHATVSRRLAKAEADAGLIFFERLPAGLRLTEPGRAVLDRANAIEPQLNELERYLMSQEDGLSGPLRVTIPPLMMTGEVSRDIAEFSAKHPEIELEFVGDNNLLNLHQREADVAIRVTHKPPDTLWGRKITDQHSGFYAQSHWLASNPLGKGDLTGDFPLVSFNAWKSPVPKLLMRCCPNVRVVARCDDMVTAMRLVGAGFGITRMPRILGDSLDGVSRITALPWERYLPLWILTHPDLRKTPRVEAFMQHIASRISARQQDYRVAETELA